MDQSVMTFADSASRGSAIGTATEGMVSYLNNTNSLELYDGSSWGQLNPSSGNAIINGAFDIWQRGTAVSTGVDNTQFYTADRFFVQRDGTGSTATVTRQTFTPGAAPVAGYEGQFFFRFDQTVAGSGGATSQVRQFIEDVRSFAGQTITVSFFAKADSARTLRGTAIVQAFGSGGSTAVSQVGSDIAITTSWARYSQTFTLDSVSGKTIGAGSALGITIRLPLNVVQTIDIWGVQVEAGSTATPFRRNANSLQGELAACQRYYVRFAAELANYYIAGRGNASSTTNVVMQYPTIVEMRTKPASIDFSALNVYDEVSAIPVSAATVATLANTKLLQAALTCSGATQFRTYTTVSQGGTVGFIGFSAEL
jgi:hypothetical protein